MDEWLHPIIYLNMITYPCSNPLTNNVTTFATRTQLSQKLVCEVFGGFSNSMMTSSNGNIFRETGPLCGEFTGPGEFPKQRPVTRSFDVFFDLRLDKRLSK